jgi:hypothetical protein
MPTWSRGHSSCQKQASRSLWGFIFPFQFALKRSNLLHSGPFLPALLQLLILLQRYFSSAHIFFWLHIVNSHQEMTLTMKPRHSKPTNQSLICRVLPVMLVHINVCD